MLSESQAISIEAFKKVFGKNKKGRRFDVLIFEKKDLESGKKGKIKTQEKKNKN